MAMAKRKLGKTGLEVSLLGFGCMRLPTHGDDKTAIDIPVAMDMVRFAIDNGVNYLDTAWPYHGNNFPQPGASEPFVATALADGYRDKVILATKLPVWIIESRKDMDAALDAQLKRLGTSHIDVYLVHNLNTAYWGKMRNCGVLEFLDDAVRDGRIRHPGFSFHDSLPLFREIMDAYDWQVVQIQYNYLDTAYQAGEVGFRLAAERGAGIVIMEPLRGGFLINHMPEELKTMLHRVRPDWSLADWAFRWVYSQPDAATTLSGMSTMEQVVENVRIASGSVDFGDKEREALKTVRTWFIDNLPVNCTSCGYCLPCPVGIRIPDNFTYYNEYHMANTDEMHSRVKGMYTSALAANERAENCVACHVCEGRCPQNIPIAERMRDIVRDLGPQ